MAKRVKLSSLSGAARAREEKRRHSYLRRPLPKDHPYAVLPAWVPYSIAKLLTRLMNRRAGS